METSIVSKPILTLCVLISIVLLITIALISYNQRSFISVCNYNNILELYGNINREDILISPQNDKATLECIGKSMPFYDRTLEYIVGKVPTKIQNQLESRYKLGERKRTLVNQIVPGKTTISITSNDNTIIVFQRTVELDELMNVIDSQKNLILIVPEEFQTMNIFKVLEEKGYTIKYVSEKRILRIPV